MLYLTVIGIILTRINYCLVISVTYAQTDVKTLIAEKLRVKILIRYYIILAVFKEI